MNTERHLETVFSQMFGKDMTMADLNQFFPDRKPAVKRMVIDGELQEIAGVDENDLSHAIKMVERRRNTARITAELDFKTRTNDNPFIPGTITHRAYGARMAELNFPDNEIF
jgi:hypothetical protein